jgi:hypothetical protein
MIFATNKQRRERHDFWRELTQEEQTAEAEETSGLFAAKQHEK